MSETVNIKVSKERITPAMAEKLLNKNKANRKLRTGIVEKYAADMMSGRWTPCAMPIVWYSDDELADGQHRLYAIIESGKAQEFVVLRGFPKEAGLNLDNGLLRTVMDNAGFAGVEELTHKLLATTKAIEAVKYPTRGRAGAMSRGLSYAERLELVEKHREAARWAIANGPSATKVGNALVWGAIARAWYHEEDKGGWKPSGG